MINILSISGKMSHLAYIHFDRTKNPITTGQPGKVNYDRFF